MNVFFRPVFLVMALAWATGVWADASDTAQLVAQHPYLVGTWSGQGRLMDRDRDRAYGPMQVAVVISPRGLLTARIGEAELTDVEIETAKFGFLVSGKLLAPVKAGKQLQKPWAYILMVFPEENPEQAHSLESNFHLKSNRVFDFSMYVGGVRLERPGDKK